MSLKFPGALWRQRELCWRLTEREVLGRYRGSLFGVGWSFLHPLAMLAIYTFVFAHVFKAKWGTGAESGDTLGYSIQLFAGLIVFNLAAECINKAPQLILSNPNYVKKVVFPLEVMGVVTVFSAGLHGLVSLLVLILFQLVAYRSLEPTILLVPLAWLPLCLGLLAATWALSALGVFIRDIGQVTGVAMSMLMFLSPIFFPLSALPPQWQPLLQLNPLAIVIEQTRRVAIDGQLLSGAYVFVGTMAGLLLCELSFRCFLKAKRGFADVM